MYITMKMVLTMDYRYGKANILGQKRDADENPIEVINKNLILDSRVNTIKFDYGKLCKYAENLIDENMYYQVNDEG